MRDSDGGFLRWTLRQVPEVQGGFMAMDVNTGRVLAMQGGFSYQSSVFNRATQAQRQPGSSFKPFVYAAALDNNYTPATIVVDEPIGIDTPRACGSPRTPGGTLWPDAPAHGDRAVAQPDDHPHRPRHRHGQVANTPRGSGSMTGWRRSSQLARRRETTLFKMVAAYASSPMAAKVEPTLVDRVQDRYGRTIYRHDQRACEGCTADDIAAAGGPWSIRTPSG